MKEFIDVFIEPFLILATLLLVLWKGYLTKKGENAATKEDIEEITKKIESVKREIEIGKESAIGFQTLKREAIVKYMESLQSVYMYFESTHLENPDLKKIRSEIKEVNDQMGHSVGSLSLFVEEIEHFQPNMTALNILFYGFASNYIEAVQCAELDAMNQGNLNQFHIMKTNSMAKIRQQISIITPKFREIIKAGIKA